MTSPESTRRAAVDRAAQRLYTAHATGRPCAPVRDLIGTEDIALAYAVQAELRRRRERDGAHRIGWKIGLTNPAVQTQLGVDQPDFGELLTDMRLDGGVLDPANLIAPRIEAEVAVHLAHDLDDAAAISSPGLLRDAVTAAAPALEIVDSRIADWDITIADTVADNASSGAFVLGAPVPRAEAGLDALAELPMTMALDGRTVSQGSGRDCLGDPMQALAWLAGTALDLGTPLRRSDVVLTGALGAMTPLGSGRYRADLGRLGPVELHVHAPGGADRRAGEGSRT